MLIIIIIVFITFIVLYFIVGFYPVFSVQQIVEMYFSHYSDNSKKFCIHTALFLLCIDLCENIEQNLLLYKCCWTIRIVLNRQIFSPIQVLPKNTHKIIRSNPHDMNRLTLTMINNMISSVRLLHLPLIKNCQFDHKLVLVQFVPHRWRLCKCPSSIWWWPRLWPNDGRLRGLLFIRRWTRRRRRSDRGTLPVEQLLLQFTLCRGVGRTLEMTVIQS